MEFLVAVAIGLNPYVGGFVLTALTAFTRHGPKGDLGEVIPSGVFALVAVLLGLAAPIDFVLGKFHRFAPQARRISQVVAALVGALFVTIVSDADVPLALMAGLGALISWSVASMLTSAAARASRAPSWVGLGHIPVLMAAATTAACIVPLGMAKPGIGVGVAATACLPLLLSTYATARRSLASAFSGQGSIFARALARVAVR